MTESEIQQRIQIDGPFIECILLRNNSGAFQDKTGRMVRFGLGNISPNQKTKSSDLIGITTVIVTPDMVGKKIGVFTAIEVKGDSWKFEKKLDQHEQYQKNFIDFVLSKGGFAGFANSLDTFRSILKR